MRYLVVLVMCCLPEVVEAEEKSWIWIEKEDGSVATCNETLTRCWVPCESRMKEAMKAVDRYLPHPQDFTGSTLEYCDDVCMAERALDAAKKQAAAMAKWRAVYKECVQ